MSELPPIDAAPTEPDPGPASGPAPSLALPWEEPNAGLGSIVPTVIQFVTNPSRAFGRMSLTVDLVRPLTYFVALVLLSVPIGQFWRYVFWSRATSGLDLIPKDVLAQAPWLELLLGRPTILVVVGLMVVAPVLNFISLFIWSGLVHACLMMVGGGRSGFAATVRVTCYCRTADLAVLIPLAGGLVQPIWFLVLQIVGLSRAHRVSGGKAAFAVLAPLVLCCGCLLGLVALSGFAASGLLKQ